jgi:hypothetical protein
VSTVVFQPRAGADAATDASAARLAERPEMRGLRGGVSFGTPSRQVEAEGRVSRMLAALLTAGPIAQVRLDRILGTGHVLGGRAQVFATLDGPGVSACLDDRHRN